MREVYSTFIEQVSSATPRLLISLVILLVFWLGGVLLQKFVHRIAVRNDLNRDLFRFIGKTVKIALLVIGTVTALGTLGINVTALVAGLGLTGFAVGFALKDILSNLISGILIMVYQPFRTTDHITVKGIAGEVAEINLRYTAIQTEDSKILVPNSTLYTNPITVHSKGAG